MNYICGKCGLNPLPDYAARNCKINGEERMLCPKCVRELIEPIATRRITKSFKVKPSLWREFKKLAIDLDTTASELLESIIIEEMSAT